MMNADLLLLVGLSILLFSLGSGAKAENVLLRESFSGDPAQSGWTLRGNGNETAQGKADKNALLVERGYWQSPALEVKALAYYRIRFVASAPRPGYVAAFFYDSAGNELAADVYDRVHVGERQTQRFCIRAHALAKQMRIRFQAMDGPVTAHEVAVEAISEQEALLDAELLAASLPPLHYTPPAERWGQLPHTMHTLRNGGTLRIVLLGDSIANDTSNSLFELFLRQKYPRARIEVIPSVRGGTGCKFYKDNAHVSQYVLALRPDLLIIAGISQGYDSEAIRSVIEQVRLGSTCDIMLMSGAVCPKERSSGEFIKNSGLPQDEARRMVETYPARLAKMAAAERVEYLDMRSAWDDCIAGCGRELEWFLRDPVHANTRGKQVLGRIIQRYFTAD